MTTASELMDSVEGLLDADLARLRLRMQEVVRRKVDEIAADPESDYSRSWLPWVKELRDLVGRVKEAVQGSGPRPDLVEAAQELIQRAYERILLETNPRIQQIRRPRTVKDLAGLREITYEDIEHLKTSEA